MEERVLCQSAGLSAVDGTPVSENAVLACRENRRGYFRAHRPADYRRGAAGVGPVFSHVQNPRVHFGPGGGCLRQRSTYPSISPTPLGVRWRSTGPAGTSWPSSWKFSTRAMSHGCWCLTTPCPSSPLRGSGGPGRERGRFEKKRFPSAARPCGRGRRFFCALPEGGKKFPLSLEFCRACSL